MNNSDQNQQGNSTLHSAGNLLQFDNLSILRPSDLNANFSKGFSTSFKPVSSLNLNGGSIIKPVALKRPSSQVSTPLAGLSNFSSFSNAAGNGLKKAIPQISTQELEKENISNATFSFLTSQLQQQFGQVSDMMQQSSPSCQQKQNNLIGSQNQDNNIILMQAHQLAQALLEQSKGQSNQQQQQQQIQQQQQQSNSSIEDQLIRELQLSLQFELNQQQNQSTPLSSSTLINLAQEQNLNSNSSPLLQFLSSEIIQNEFNQTPLHNNNPINKQSSKDSSCLIDAKKFMPASEEQDEATSPCLIKKRKVQKNLKSSQQNLNEQKSEEMEQESCNQENKEQRSSSSLQQGQIKEVKLVQKKQGTLSKKGQKKGKKASENVQQQECTQDEQKNSSKDLDLIQSEDDQEKCEDGKALSAVSSEKELQNEQDQQNMEDEMEEQNQEESSSEDDKEKQTLSQQQQKILLQIGENQGNGANKKTRVCNCKKTKCLKLYCDCFAAGEFCGGDCNCCDCSNTVSNKEARNKIVEGLLEKNPFAFNVKDIEVEEVTQLSLKAQKKLASKKGCNCRRSGCLKKYCQCYQDGLQCGEHCKCNGCENCEKPAKKLFIAEQNSLSLQSQASNSSNLANNIPLNGQSQLLNNNVSLIKSNSNILSLSETQTKQYQTSPSYSNQLNIQQNINKTNKSISSTSSNNNNNTQTGFNFNSNNSAYNNSNSNQLNNNMDDNTQQFMLTQLLSNMVTQQNLFLNNPLIQLATLQASIQQTLMQQSQQNNYDNSIESLLLQAAAVAASTSFKDTSRLNK